MAFHEIAVPADDARAEGLSDALMELGALSVSVEDRDAGTESEHALFGEPGMPVQRATWQNNVVRALFDDEAAADSALLSLLTHGLLPDLAGVARAEVAEQDWVRLTQSQFQPVNVAGRLWIVPSWHDAPAEAEIVIRLDPGLAFGTGTHPTTRLCLDWLVRHPAPATLLDYGCGSGILAIAAAKLGAGAVAAVDIDPAAVDSCRANATANGVALAACCHVDDLAPGRHDVVVANILASPLRLLAPMLAARVAPAGSLVLSGILARQADELIEVYAPWAALSVWGEDDGWVCLAGPVRDAS